MPNKNWLYGGAAVLVLLILGVIGWRFNPAGDKQSVENNGQELMATLLGNVSLKPFIEDLGTVEFENGLAADGKLRLMENRTAFGDLNGDGQSDASVILEETNGGNGSYFSLVAIRNEDGKPVYAGGIYLGDRIVVDDLEITDGVVTIKYLSHGPDDYLTAPTHERIERFRLSGDELVAI